MVTLKNFAIMLMEKKLINLTFTFLLYITRPGEISQIIHMQREYYDTGELLSEVFVINGKKEGKCKIYYANGNINVICHYVNNKLNGVYINYFMNIPGQIYDICYFLDDIKQGECKRYYDNGQLLEIYYCVNNERHGEYISYYRDGTRLLNMNYTNGRKNGLYQNYNAIDDITETWYYENGIPMDL